MGIDHDEESNLLTRQKKMNKKKYCSIKYTVYYYRHHILYILYIVYYSIF